MSKRYLGIIETPFRDIGKETGSKMREADIQLLILSMHTHEASSELFENIMS